MSNYILKNDAIILRCANWAMELYRNELQNVVKESNYSNSPLLLSFIEKLDQNIHGRGCVCIEINDFFNHDESNEKLPIKILNTLTNKIVQELKTSEQFHPNFIKLLEEFNKKLI